MGLVGSAVLARLAAAFGAGEAFNEVKLRRTEAVGGASDAAHDTGHGSKQCIGWHLDYLTPKGPCKYHSMSPVSM